MKKEIQKKVLQYANFIETFIGALLTIAIGVLAIFLIVEFKDVILSENWVEKFNDFLASALNLVIGIEFIKMLCKHTPETVIEVLLFAIARQLIVEHTTTVENFAGIVSIAILFTIRKYLFCKERGDKVFED